VSRRVDQMMATSMAKEKNVIKLLLLGAGESGKSTIFKQLTNMYGKGFPESERLTYSTVIHVNVLASIIVLADKAPNYGTLSSASEEARSNILALQNQDTLHVTTEIATSVATLWADPVVKTAFDNRSQFQN